MLERKNMLVNGGSLLRGLVLLFLLSFSGVAYSQEYVGYDVLGVAKYCEQYLRAPRLPAVSTLLNTFGDPMPCIDRSAARGDIKLVQIDFQDATCFRNRVCPPGTPPLGDKRTLRQRALSVKRVADKYPGIRWQCSPFLEHDIKDPNVIRRACADIRAVFPACECVNSPFMGTRQTGLPLELHGTKVSTWSVSGDGASIFDGDNIDGDGNTFNHTRSGSFSTYAWFNSMNLRCPGEKSFTPPSKRTHRPTGDEFSQAAHLFTPTESIPTAPLSCKRVRQVDGRRGEIVKTNAENYCNGQPNEADPRGTKPLLIIRKSGRVGDRFNVVDRTGKQVGCFRYFGTFETPGTHRWYMGDCSGQSPWELYKALGNSEWGFAQLGGGECLLFNAVRRQGTYR